MAKRNRNKLKQRKKRQLKRALKYKVTKEVQYPDYILPPPIDTEAKHKERDQAYQKELDKVYKGTVTALSHYVNARCTMAFQCNSCGLIFFNNAGHMVSDKEHERHECHTNYGTVHSKRFTMY